MDSTTRPRIDLDGVALHDPANPHMVLAVFRYRLRAGLELLLPESGEWRVPWQDVESAVIDLAAGSVHLAFTAGFTAANQWMRGSRVLTGSWIDRVELAHPSRPTDGPAR